MDLTQNSTTSREAKISVFVTKVVDEMVKHVVKKYNIPSFSPKIILRFSPRFHSSWGGVRGSKPFMSFSLLPYLPDAKTYLMNEYASICNDSEIGSVRGSWQKCVAALVAHEMAHVIQYMDKLNISQSSAFSNYSYADKGGHGIVWKTIYRDLRNTFVKTRAYRDIKIEVAKPATVEPPAPAKPTAARRTREMSVETIRKGWKGGLLFLYFRKEPREWLGSIFAKKGFYLQYLPVGETEWKNTTSTSVVEIRKLFID